MSDLAQQDQFNRKLQSRLQTELVFEINEEVISTFDLPRLMDVLTGTIKQLGISICFLCLNDDPGSAVGLEMLPQYSRLIMAYIADERLELEPGGVRFPTTEFIPKGIMQDNQRNDLVVLPLRFQDRYLGYAVFEMGYHQDRFIYDALQIQISSVINGAFLLDQLSQAQIDLERRVEERTADLQNEIVERSRVEKVLRENDQRFRALFDQTTDAVFLFDLDTQHIMVNQKAADMLGYTIEELIGMGGGKFLAPGEINDAQNKLEIALRGKPVPLYERNLIHKDGHLIPVEINLSLVTDSDGNPLHFQSIVRDISKRKHDEAVLKAEIDERIKAEGILLENEQRYRALFEQTADAVLLFDLDIRHIMVNQTAADMLGYTVEEMVGMVGEKLVAPDEYEDGVSKLELARQGKNVPLYERNLLHKAGHLIPVEINLSMVTDTDGNPLHFQSIVRDISKRKHTERILQALNSASLAMRQALIPEDVFRAVGNELRRLGLGCTIFQANQDQSQVIPLYFNYEGKIISVLEKLLNVQAKKFSISVEAVDVFQKTIWERETVFNEVGGSIIQVFPGQLKSVVNRAYSIC